VGRIDFAFVVEEDNVAAAAAVGIVADAVAEVGIESVFVVQMSYLGDQLVDAAHFLENYLTITVLCFALLDPPNLVVEPLYALPNS
jgi:hypothetical protein